MSPANDKSELIQALEMVLENNRLCADDDTKRMDRLTEILKAAAVEIGVDTDPRAFLDRCGALAIRPTFTLLDNGQAIKCFKCGLTSYNINDVRNLYCGKCKEFHDKNAQI